MTHIALPRVVPHNHFFIGREDINWDCMNPFCIEHEGIGWRPWSPEPPPAYVKQARELEHVADRILLQEQVLNTTGETGLANRLRGFRTALQARVDAIIAGRGQ